MLRRLPQLTPDGSVFDDAALWPINRRQSLVSTVDFFAPVVDDARIWGAIAAANSVSDVYAMGAKPLFALNIVAWPRDLLPLDLLGDVLAGGAEIAAEGGWSVVGGHSVDAPEPMYGMAVTGIAKTRSVLTLDGARPGDALVLTKPLGSGVLATAIKGSSAEAISPGGPLAAIYAAGVKEMMRLNAEAAAVALQAKASAATDITGFGLLGHLREMARAAGASAQVFAAEVPLLPDLLQLFSSGNISGGSQRNLTSVEPILQGGNAQTRQLLSDAQTSGGLLFSCKPGQAVRAVSRLHSTGHNAAVIGEIVPPLAMPAGGSGASTSGGASAGGGRASANGGGEGVLLIEGELADQTTGQTSSQTTGQSAPE